MHNTLHFGRIHVIYNSILQIMNLCHLVIYLHDPIFTMTNWYCIRLGDYSVIKLSVKMVISQKKGYMALHSDTKDRSKKVKKFGIQIA